MFSLPLSAGSIAIAKLCSNLEQAFAVVEISDLFSCRIELLHSNQPYRTLSDMHQDTSQPLTAEGYYKQPPTGPARIVKLSVKELFFSYRPLKH